MKHLILLFITISFTTFNCHSIEESWIACKLPITTENIKEVTLTKEAESISNNYILSKIHSYNFSKSYLTHEKDFQFPTGHNAFENQMINAGSNQWQAISLKSSFFLVFFPGDSSLTPRETILPKCRYFIFDYSNKAIFEIVDFLSTWPTVASTSSHIWIDGRFLGNVSTAKLSREDPLKITMIRFQILIEDTQGDIVFQKIQELNDVLLASIWIIFPHNVPKDPVKGLAYSKDYGTTWTLIGYFNQYIDKFQDFAFRNDGQGWLLYQDDNSQYIQKVVNWNQFGTQIKTNGYFSSIFLNGDDVYLGIYEKTYIPFLKWPQNADLKQIFQIAHKGTLYLKDGKWNESMKPE